MYGFSPKLYLTHSLVKLNCISPRNPSAQRFLLYTWKKKGVSTNFLLDRHRKLTPQPVGVPCLRRWRASSLVTSDFSSGNCLWQVKTQTA
jgi:hypothetical protein